MTVWGVVRNKKSLSAKFVIIGDVDAPVICTTPSTADTLVATEMDTLLANAPINPATPWTRTSCWATSTPVWGSVWVSPTTISRVRPPSRPPWALMWMAAKLTRFNELSPYRANGPVSGIRAPTFTFCAIEGGANPVRAAIARAANTPIGRRENTWVTPDKHRLARSGQHSATAPRKVVRAMELINTEHGSQGPTLVSQSFTQLPGTAETACLIGDHTLDRWRERGFTVLFRLFQRTAFGARAWSRCPRLFSRGRLSQILPLTLIWRAFGKIQRLGRQYGIAKRIGLELDEHPLHLLQPAQMNTLCGHNAIVSVADVDFLNAIFRYGQS